MVPWKMMKNGSSVAPGHHFFTARDRVALAAVFHGLEAHGHATRLRTGWANHDALGTCRGFMGTSGRFWGARSWRKPWENHGKTTGKFQVMHHMNINDTSSSASSTKKGNLQRQWPIACPESYHGAGQEWGMILRLTLLEIALCAVSLWDFRGLSCC